MNEFILCTTQRNLCKVTCDYITNIYELFHKRDVQDFILTVGVIAGDVFGTWYSHWDNRHVRIEAAVSGNQRPAWWMQEQCWIHSQQFRSFVLIVVCIKQFQNDKTCSDVISRIPYCMLGIPGGRQLNIVVLLHWIACIQQILQITES